MQHTSKKTNPVQRLLCADAEGRLVLADALVEADSDDPDLIIDAATLTGSLPPRCKGYRDSQPLHPLVLDMV